MSVNTYNLAVIAIVVLGFLAMVRGCAGYDLDMRCIKATGAPCVEAPL